MAELRPARLRYLTGNRLELLAERLSSELAVDPLAPGLRETIVVPSRGLGSWLTRELALRWGIAASLDLPFPPRFVDGLAERFGLGRPEPLDPFRPAAQLFDLHDLFWKIQNGQLQLPALASVADHLRDDADGRKRYQLSRRVSQLFESYQFGRPQQVESWLEGGWFSAEGPDPGEEWQRELFVHLASAHATAAPPARRILELLRRLGRGDFEDEWLPERLSVFGASTLPPMIAQVLVALAAHRPVDVYLLVPTSGYLGDLRSRREREHDADETELAATEELVGELGRLGREFFAVLLDLDTAGGAIEEAGFEDPGSGSILHHLQSCLLDPRTATTTIDAPDRSLRLHSCHSPMREMEVLRDEILGALADGAAESVADVLLLVPDIRTYERFARSVFGAAIENGGHTLRVPVRVADRHAAADQPYGWLIGRWLRLAAARLTLAEVFPVLQEPVVEARFGFTDEDLDAMRERLRDAGVIWGIDPESRARRSGTPEFAGVSWRDGIDRLLLGCFTGPVDAMVDGVLPAADAAVADTERLGDLADALDRLFALLVSLEGPLPMEGWVERIRGGLLELTDAPDERHAVQRAACLELLDRLSVDAGGSTAPMGRLAVLDLLERELAAMQSGAGFVSGMLTVAELRPMRSLPAAVIAVAGLDAESFPRSDADDGLDLARRHRRAGDRSPRDDDRQLFLELLLSARQRLILSWVGRSQSDDHERPASVCIQELLETLDALGTGIALVQHSLQPFVSVHCQESTYDHATVRAAEALGDRGPVARFVDAPLPEPDRPALERIELEDLRQFWVSPAKWYCQRVLGLALNRDREEASAEGFGLDALQQWKLRDLGLRRGGSLPHEPELRARLGLPANPLVTSAVSEIRAEFEAADWTHVEEALEVAGEDFVVGGVLRRRADGSVLEAFAAGSAKPKYRVSALVAHAFAGAAGIEQATHFGPVKTPHTMKSWARLADPPDVLARLIEGFRIGQTTPLPFYPRTSLEFAKRRDGTDPVDVFRSAEVQREWSARAEPGAPFGADGERWEEAVDLCVRGWTEEEICNEAFVRWAEDFAAWLQQAAGTR